jgi:hypothetical protein
MEGRRVRGGEEWSAGIGDYDVSYACGVREIRMYYHLFSKFGYAFAKDLPVLLLLVYEDESSLSGVCLLSGSHSATQPPPVHPPPSASNRADLVPDQSHATPLGSPIDEACQAMPRHLITTKTVLRLLWCSWAPLLVDQRSCSCSWMKLIARRGRSAQHTCCELPLARSWPEPRATSA